MHVNCLFKFSLPREGKGYAGNHYASGDYPRVEEPRGRTMNEWKFPSGAPCLLATVGRFVGVGISPMAPEAWRLWLYKSGSSGRG